MARSSLLLVLVPLLTAAVLAEAFGHLPLRNERRSYTGWKVVRIFTSDSSLDDFLKILLEQEEVSVWGMKRLANNEIQVDALVGPRFSVDLIVTFMTERDAGNNEGKLIHWHTIIEDVEAAMNQNKATVRAGLSSKLDWTAYHRFDVIEDYLLNIVANRLRADIVKVGTSIEGRAIYATVIGNRSKKVASLISAYLENAERGSSNDEVAEEIPVTTLGPISGHEGLEVKGALSDNVIFMEAGIHAREWITPAFATYMIDQLTAEDKEFLDLATWVIIPVANPDGYEFSHTVDRLWRKNRRPNPKSTTSYICAGVDLNRNFGRNFGGKGTSSDECSEIYRGKSAFSEPETKAMRNAFLSLKGQVKFYMAIHSYGEIVLFPWGDTLDSSLQEASLKEVATSIAASISRFNVSNYKVGQSSKAYTFASGASDDYFHDQGVKLAYTIELPEDNTGFLIPAEKILPVSVETYCGLRCVAYQVAEKTQDAKKCWESCGV